MAISRLGIILYFCVISSCLGDKMVNSNSVYRSIADFNVVPENDAQTNKINLQKAFDWASPKGATLYVTPSATPYRISGGLVLRRNVSLIGVHAAIGRAAVDCASKIPVGSVFSIEDENNTFITVEAATQIRGIQFWYPKQTISDPSKIIKYPTTIKIAADENLASVTLSSLAFFGEYTAMDFNSPTSCEQLLFEHCYGYPLSGKFIIINRCYDIPRILHCHVNPANLRFISGDFSKAVVDSVVSKKTFAYDIDNTDNAQIMDVFTFGTYGGIRLGSCSYGQMTNFNFDCVTVGILKEGDQTFNRTWMISQGAIIANAGTLLEDIHPIIVEGSGFLGLSNVEAFSGDNGAVTNCRQSQDFMLIRGHGTLAVSLSNCRMANYVAESPITILNKKVTLQHSNCIDKDYNPLK